MGAISALAEGLLLSGFAMQERQSSRPASGAGHNFSHQWEMEAHGLDWNPPLTHGIKVGLGAIASCALYEAVLGLDVSGVDPEARAAEWLTPEEDVARVTALQPQPAIREQAIVQSQLKYVPAEQVAGAQRRPQPPCHRADDLVTDPVTVLIVDLFEQIDVGELPG